MVEKEAETERKKAVIGRHFEIVYSKITCAVQPNSEEKISKVSQTCHTITLSLQYLSLH